MSNPESKDSYTGLETAIVGIAGRFPGAKNIEEFWENLRDGKESIRTFTDDELIESGIDPILLKNPNYIRSGTILEGADMFDAEFFGYNPRELEIMDPQQRVFLECAWEAMENSGYNSKTLDGSIGVFAGTNMNTYILSILSAKGNARRMIDPVQAEIGNDKDYIATRVSYKLNLDGPSVVVQSACSSALVAVHTACRALLGGECDMALAGGVGVRVPLKSGYVYQKGGLFSHDGHCRAFDAKASGTVFGSGVGIVVLKRLSDAINDRDNIYAVIKGSAVNNDGSSKVGYTAPSVDGQTKVIKTAQLVSEVEARSISYIEAHGTGTNLGDPIELSALTNAFRTSTKDKGFCAIGSVKSNIGHLAAASGAASLIKTALALKNKKLPPSINFEKPNPNIDFESTPFYVNNKLSEWESSEMPRRAGVSSFGVGGTNAHIILEEAPDSYHGSAPRKHNLLVFSAKTETALQTMVKNFVLYLKKNPTLNISDAAYTLQTGREEFKYRRAVVCSDINDALEKLDSPDPKSESNLKEDDKPAIVFMFTGQGSQYVNMAAELYTSEPIFKEQVDKCLNILKPYLGLDLKDILYPDGNTTEATEKLKQTFITQPALFVIEYAMAKLWMEWGVKPKAMIGHSIGEYVAACIAEVLTLEDALKLVAARGRLMQSLPAGAMLSVSMSEEEVKPFLNEGVSVATINAPGFCVVSGNFEAIKQLEEKLSENGKHCRRLQTSHAFHSVMMEPILEQYEALVREIKLSEPKIPYISNVTGTWITASDATRPDYWSKHLRQPVRFSDGVQELLKSSEYAFLEMGPGKTLCTLLGQHKEAVGRTILSSIPQPHEDINSFEFLTNTLGKEWLAGVDINWRKIYSKEKRYRVSLPSYPFEKQRYWIDVDVSKEQEYSQEVLPDKKDISRWFYMPVWKEVPFSNTKTEIKGECWLLMDNGQQMSKLLAKDFASNNIHVISVTAGEDFIRHGNNEFTIKPSRKEDYNTLFEAIYEEGYSIKRVVHLWGLYEKEKELDHYSKFMDLCFYSIINVTKAIGRYNNASPLTIDIVTSNMERVKQDEEVCAEKAVVLGPCRVIPQEFPNITCNSIDIDLNGKAETTAAEIVRELYANCSGDTIAYREGKRWRQDFEEIEIGENNIQQIPRLKEKGVYLITGGLGGIGLVLAQYLAEETQAKLILTGRSVFPEKSEWDRWLSSHDENDEINKKICLLKTLEAAGAEVVVARADSADKVQMQELIASIRQRFGGINGVIHTAGVPGGGIIQMRSADKMEAVLAPKVKGTLVLEEVLKGENLDFLVLCSSTLAILGGIGQVDYCAANSFLDAFAHNYMLKYGTYAVSINWDAWEEVGMAVNSAAQYAPLKSKKEEDFIDITHPLFKRYKKETPDRVVFESKFDIESCWLLKEHRVMGKSTIPGTAYLEMASATFNILTENSYVELQDIFFLSPLMVDEKENKQVYTVFEREDDSYILRVKSFDGQKTVEHVKGKVLAAVSEEFGTLDLKEIIGKCNTSVYIPDTSDSDVDGIVYWGPRWSKNLKKVYIGDNEALALLELPEEFRDDLREFRLHPALLDVATGFAAQFKKEEGDFLPLAYKRIRVKEALPAEIYSYIRYREDNDARKQTIAFDITLLDKDGRILVDIKVFELRKVGVGKGDERVE
ncbi:type I polyketide synthase [Ruminiclostridium cellulolyticum]|uniref:Beta-ketoacyl synthase n=1 Tax=Ruminiclostridium cellulolyticum (strain ATCC 35319 / DSM 5812 / JCM 6584 / H10) TaxID=394503 RepID=B8I980_RUMCH|nr:type I polyketide synthase [Ruminiclostridium cellulolyticum]ACL75340.1 Beta-ketoacyl synthase [Ruminiclostridium cellulolyticum H10]